MGTTSKLPFGTERLVRKGFSLAEIVLAMALLAVIAVSLVLTFLSQARFGRETKERVAATAIAVQLLDRMKRVPSTDLPVGPAVFDGAVPDPITGAAFPPAPYPTWTAEGVEYTVRVTVSSGPTPDLTNLFVEVTWPEGKLGMETLCKR